MPPEAAKLIGDIDSNALFAALEQPARTRSARPVVFRDAARGDCGNGAAAGNELAAVELGQAARDGVHASAVAGARRGNGEAAEHRRAAARRRRVHRQREQLSVEHDEGHRRRSFRMALDVGNWDAALAFNVPGQSGDPQSAPLRRPLRLVAKDTRLPLLYSRGAIEKATEMKILLTPAK
jgi:hypothetical protein